MEHLVCVHNHCYEYSSTYSKFENNAISDLLVPFPKRQILDYSKLKEFADDNFKFDDNGRKLSKWVENTVGKGEIARYVLFFPQCFQKTCTVNT